MKDKVYILHYNKEFKSGERTQHYKISKDRQKLFNWVVNFCKERGMLLEKSNNPNHKFLFSDGNWVYYGKSDYCNVEFSCFETELF